MKEDNISQLGDYDAPFFGLQYTHGSCYISLFKFKSFDQFSTPHPTPPYPKLPQILDIYTVVALLSKYLEKILLTAILITSLSRDTYFHTPSRNQTKL